MPYVCQGPISRRVGDESIQLKRGDLVPDALAEELRKTHKHVLTRVAHTAHNCQRSCDHHSHEWNQAPSAPVKSKPVLADAVSSNKEGQK